MRERYYGYNSGTMTLTSVPMKSSEEKEKNEDPDPDVEYIDLNILIKNNPNLLIDIAHMHGHLLSMYINKDHLIEALNQDLNHYDYSMKYKSIKLDKLLSHFSSWDIARYFSNLVYSEPFKIKEFFKLFISRIMVDEEETSSMTEWKHIKNIMLNNLKAVPEKDIWIVDPTAEREWDREEYNANH